MTASKANQPGRPVSGPATPEAQTSPAVRADIDSHLDRLFGQTAGGPEPDSPVQADAGPQPLPFRTDAEGAHGRPDVAIDDAADDISDPASVTGAGPGRWGMLALAGGIFAALVLTFVSLFLRDQPQESPTVDIVLEAPSGSAGGLWNTAAPEQARSRIIEPGGLSGPRQLEAGVVLGGGDAPRAGGAEAGRNGGDQNGGLRFSSDGLSEVLQTEPRGEAQARLEQARAQLERVVPTGSAGMADRLDDMAATGKANPPTQVAARPVATRAPVTAGAADVTAKKAQADAAAPATPVAAAQKPKAEFVWPPPAPVNSTAAPRQPAQGAEGNPLSTVINIRLPNAAAGSGQAARGDTAPATRAPVRPARQAPADDSGSGGAGVAAISPQAGPMLRAPELRTAQPTGAVLPERPWLAIVVMHDGQNSAALRAAAERLPGAFSFALSPFAADRSVTADALQAGGHEVLLGIPMQPLSYPRTDPGPNAILIGNSLHENQKRTLWALDQLDDYDGVFNMMGSAVSVDEAALGVVLANVQKRGVYYLDSRSIGRTLGPQVASRIGLAHTVNDRFIDRVASAESIDAELDKLVQVARARGHATGMATASALTIDRLERFAARAERLGISLVPVSLIARQP